MRTGGRMACCTGFPGLDWRCMSARHHSAFPVYSLFPSLLFLSPFLALFLSSFLPSTSMLTGLSKIHDVHVTLAEPHLSHGAEKLLSLPSSSALFDLVLNKEPGILLLAFWGHDIREYIFSKEADFQ